MEFVKLATTYSKVNLGQGFPDFPAPDFLREALSRALSGGNHMLHQYTRAFVSGQISLSSTTPSLPVSPGCFRARQAATNRKIQEAKHTPSLDPCPLFPVTPCFTGMFEAARLEDLTGLLPSQSPSKGLSLVQGSSATQFPPSSHPTGPPASGEGPGPVFREAAWTRPGSNDQCDGDCGGISGPVLLLPGFSG